jgi:hypothetical protein
MFGVILFHAAAAYGAMGAKYWPVHDTQTLIGSAIREVFDVFIMPVFFFIAGYFALPSIRNKTLAGFIVNKFRRLYIYWLLFVLFFMPIGTYFMLKYDHSHTNYLSFWFNSLSICKNARNEPLVQGMYMHMHFWFVSLLFYVLILFGVFYKAGGKSLFKRRSFSGEKYKGLSLLNIAVFSILTASAYYLFILLYPGSYWVVVPMFIQFKTTHIPVLVLFFCYGIYSSYRGWFVNEDIPFDAIIWFCLTLLSATLFYMIGQDYFEKIDESNKLSPAYLFGFSLVRSCVIISYLILALKTAIKYFNRKKAVINGFSDVSYEIYLVHLIPIQALQFIFLQFEIPIAIKIFSVFTLGTIASYFLGKYTLYKFPKTSAVVFVGITFVPMLILYWG